MQHVDIQGAYARLCERFQLNAGQRGTLVRMAEELGIGRKALGERLKRLEQGENVPQLLADIITLAASRGFDIDWVVTGAHRPQPDQALHNENLKLQGQADLLREELERLRAEQTTRLAETVSEKVKDQCLPLIKDELHKLKAGRTLQPSDDVRDRVDPSRG